MGRRDIRTLLELAELHGRAGDVVARQRLADVWARNRLATMMAWRAKVLPTTRTGAEADLAKVFNSGTVNAARDTAGTVLGPEAQLSGSPSGVGTFQELTVFSPAPPIYAGSDQIQRNIVGERVLGLPKEPGIPSDTPFRDLPKN